MDLGITNKVAFVAASSKGLGKAVALELAREGVQVIINGRDNEALLSTREEIIAKTGASVIAIQADLTDESDRDQLIQRIKDQYGKIDILVTNGGGPPSGSFQEFDLDDWRSAFELLMSSTVAFIQAFLPSMKDQKWGRIVTITSQAIKQPVDKLILSNSVRASVAGLVKTLSNELGPYQITVNNVMPGYTKTDRLQKLLEVNPSFSNAIETVPLNRFAEPEEFAAAVAFLASQRASYITGVSLAVDGGWIKSIM